MFTAFQVDDEGRPIVELPAGKGVVPYRVQPLPAGFALWKARVAQLDGGAAYTVRLDEAGRWECECRDHQYRGRQRPCKHAIVGRRLLLLFREFGLTCPEINRILDSAPTIVHPCTMPPASPPENGPCEPASPTASKKAAT